MKKKLIAKIKFTLVAGKATPVPPVSKLNDYKINVSLFCKEYNDLTKEFLGSKIPVEILIYQDKTFYLNLKTPLTSSLLLEVNKLKKGSANSNEDKIGTLSEEQIIEIAKTKIKDLNTNDLTKAIKIVKGSMNSLGLELSN